jgi:hypothetical protein
MSSGDYDPRIARASVWNDEEGKRHDELSSDITESADFKASWESLTAGECGYEEVITPKAQDVASLEALFERDAQFAEHRQAAGAEGRTRWQWQPPTSTEVLGRLKNVVGATMTLGIGSAIVYLYQRRKGSK